MPKIATIPREPDDCGWTNVLPERRVGRRLDADRTVDVVILGAGLCGLAAARRLHELDPGLEVVVIDAQGVGRGTSGRASGFLVGETDTATALPQAAGEGYLRQSRIGIESLRRVTREAGIDCDWDDTGWLRAAAGAAGEKTLEGLVPKLESLGAECRRLDADGLFEISGSRFYRRGVRVVGAPLVNAGKLIRGLADHLPSAVTLYEESPVSAIEPGSPHRLHAPGGTLRCRHLVIAANGYAPAVGFFKSRIFPLFTFGSLTRPLSEEEQRQLGGEREWGLLAMDPMGSSVRRTRDQRILIRNTAYYDRRLRVPERRRQVALDNHRSAFDRRFPDLAGLEFESTWAGLLGSVHNAMPSFGILAPRMVGAGGFTGAGMALGTAAGIALAEATLGQRSTAVRDFERLPPATWMPPEPFRSIGGGFLTHRLNAKADPATL